MKTNKPISFLYNTGNLKYIKIIHRAGFQEIVNFAFKKHACEV